MVSLCPFQMDANANSKEMTLHLDPMLWLREKDADKFHIMSKDQDDDWF